MDLFLIRHGQTDDNAKGYYTGRRHAMLNATGERQALTVAWELEDFGITAVVCSPLIRAAQTAQVLCFEWGVPEAEFDADWIEMDFGKAAGLTYQEFREHMPEAVQAWADDWIGYTLPGGENGEALYARVKCALEKLQKSHADDRIAVVSHLGCIRFALSHLLSGGPGRFWEYSVGHGGYAHIRIENDSATLVKLVEHVCKKQGFTEL
jgi:alpha-ribazole phosphatase